MGKKELVALLNLSSWCRVSVVWLFLVVPWACLQFVIVVFPDHTNLLFLLLQIQPLALVWIMYLSVYVCMRGVFPGSKVCPPFCMT